MGFLDRVKKLASQAKDLAGDAVEKTRREDPSTGGGATLAQPAGDDLRERWKKADLVDPAGVLKAKERDRHGIPSSTKSDVVAETHGTGRRWTAEGKSAALLWLIAPDAPAAGAGATVERWQSLRSPAATDVPGVGDAAYVADTEGGRRGVFVRAKGVAFVVEVGGLGDDTAVDLAKGAAAEVPEPEPDE